jgi:hypothetical protein
MKVGILVLSAMFATASFADCKLALDIASERGNFGLAISAEATKQLNKTEELVAINSSQKSICDSALSAKEVALLAANEFSATVLAFEESAKVCTGDNDAMVAEYYADLATKNKEANLEIAKKMDKVLADKCF